MTNRLTIKFPIILVFLLESVLAAFNASTYTTNEGETVTLTVVLNTTAATEITFDVVTEDASAHCKLSRVKCYSQPISFSLSVIFFSLNCI